MLNIFQKKKKEYIFKVRINTVVPTVSPVDYICEKYKIYNNLSVQKFNGLYLTHCIGLN